LAACLGKRLLSFEFLTENKRILTFN